MMVMQTAGVEDRKS